jgi:hypothetical protein
MKDIIIWAILFFIFLIISGLYVSEYTQSDIKKYNYQQISINEYFNNPDISPVSNQKEGAEALYNWGVPANKMQNQNDHEYNPTIDYSCHNTCHKSCPVNCPKKCKAIPVKNNSDNSSCNKQKEEAQCNKQKEEAQCNKQKEEAQCNKSKEEAHCNKSKVEQQCSHNCNYTCPSPCPNKCNKPLHTYDSRFLNNDDSVYKEKIYLNTNCYTCDITTNKDMDKYVLKSSVPACPDMSEFITKNMMNSNPDLSDYILKSEIKPCEKVDYTKYVLKTSIPACPACPKIRKPRPLKEHNIKDHPDIVKYITKEDVEKYYKVKDTYKNTSLDLNPYSGHVRSSVIPMGEDLNNQLKSLSENEKEDLAKGVYNTLPSNYKKDLINELYEKLDQKDKKELSDKMSGHLTEKEKVDLNQKLFSSKLSEKEKKDISTKLNHIVEEEKRQELQYLRHLEAEERQNQNKNCQQQEQQQQHQQPKKKCESKSELEKKKTGFLDNIFDYKLTSNLLGNIKGYYTGDNVYQEY